MFLLIFKSAGYIHMDHRIIWFNQHTCGLLSSADRIFARFATAVTWSDPPLARGDSHDTSRVSIKSCFTLFSSSLLPKLLLSRKKQKLREEDWRRVIIFAGKTTGGEERETALDGNTTNASLRDTKRYGRLKSRAAKKLISSNLFWLNAAVYKCDY